MKPFLKAALVLIAACLPDNACSSEGHDHAAEPQPVIQILSLEEGVNAVAFYQREVQSHVDSNQLARVHSSAFTARDAATSTVQWAASLSPEAQEQVRMSARRIAALATQLDKYGDAGQGAETAAMSLKLKEEVDALQRITGVTVRTDWKPVVLSQGNTSHGHHGSKCPHKANHGGRFSMALNDAYHVEGSYPAPGEFRMHLYDSESCPLPASRFSGHLLLAGGEIRVDLQPSQDGKHLSAHLPSPQQPPVSVTAILSLPDPDTKVPRIEHFSYNFYRLSKPSASTSDTTATTTAGP